MAINNVRDAVLLRAWVYTYAAILLVFRLLRVFERPTTRKSQS